jgi:hypothetical protein
MAWYGSGRLGVTWTLAGLKYGSPGRQPGRRPRRAGRIVTWTRVSITAPRRSKSRDAHATPSAGTSRDRSGEMPTAGKPARLRQTILRYRKALHSALKGHTRTLAWRKALSLDPRLPFSSRRARSRSWSPHRQLAWSLRPRNADGQQREPTLAEIRDPAGVPAPGCAVRNPSSPDREGSLDRARQVVRGRARPFRPVPATARRQSAPDPGGRGRAPG